jgi:hypothetical protein
MKKKEQNFYEAKGLNILPSVKVDSNLAKATKEVISFSKFTGENAIKLTKDFTIEIPNIKTGIKQDKVFKQGTIITKYDDLILGIKNGAIGEDILGQIATGILKQKKVSLNITELMSLSDDLVMSEVFLTKYGKLNPQDLRTELANRKYSQQGIDAIEASMAKPQYQNFLKNSNIKPNAPSAGSTLGEKITNALYKNGKLKKGVRFVKYVLIAGGVGLAGYGIFAIFSDGSKIKLGDKYSEEVKKLLNPCLLPLLSNGGTIVPVSDGAQLQLKKTGNSEADSKGGVVYYPNGRVWTLDNSKKGTWSCSEIVSETMKQGTLKEAIRFRLKNLLNEQVNYDINISGVNIKWDNSNSTSSSTQPKQQMRYTPCSKFPYEYGCKSQDIKDIQEKLGFEERYITGNFGPVTKTKLKAIEKVYRFVLDDNIGITEDIYNKIMNFDSKSQPSAAQEKQNQNTIPYSKPESPFQNKVVSGAFSDLNAKKDTIGTTSTDTTATPQTAQTSPTETDTERETRITEINGVLNERPFGNVAYRGVVLNPSDEGWLLNHVNKKYGENGKYKFVKNKDRERSLRGKEVIVFQRQRNK